MKNIRLTTPTQDKHEHPAVELEPGALQSWLNNLSSSDIMATVKSLDTALSAFNEVKVPANRRHKLLEIYFASLHKLLHGYDEMRLAQLNVSARQKQHIRNDIVWLYIKLSHGYKIIIKDLLQEEYEALKSQELLLTTFRALELTVISLLHAYRFGLDTPPLTFLELHQIYSFAEYKNIANKPVKAAKGYAKTPTISSFYALALLFNSIDPTQYESYTLEVLFLALQPFLFNCQFSRSVSHRDNSFIYKVNVNDNTPPTILPTSQTAPPYEGAMYLDIGNFICEVKSWLESNKDNKNTFLVEDELALFPGILEKLDTLRATSLTSKSEPSQEAATTRTLRLAFGLYQLQSLLIMKSIGIHLNLDYKTSEWDVVTAASHHYELMHQLSDFQEILALGDLVSIIDFDDDGKTAALTQLAYISLLQQPDDEKILLRLELINGHAEPATYTITNNNSRHDQATPFNGIFLTSKEGDAVQHTLIADKAHTIQAQQLVFKTQSSRIKAAVIESIEVTSRYVFWKIRILEEQNHAPPDCQISYLAS